MLADFFRLNDNFKEIDENDLRSRIREASIKDALYRPDRWPEHLNSIRDIIFVNVSFSKTEFRKQTFTKCKFIDCLFIGSQFIEVEFHGCRFENCNMYKSSFKGCYLDPSSFIYDKIYRKTHANIGVGLYQSLLEVASSEKQAGFERKADIAFRRWKRDQLPYDYKNARINGFERAYMWASNFVYEMTSGYGYMPGRFVAFTLILFTALSLLNMALLRGGLKVDGNYVVDVGLFDSIFYTYSMMTALGFSSITPATSAAKIYAVALALTGIGWLGLFTSLLVKRFLK